MENNEAVLQLLEILSVSLQSNQARLIEGLGDLQGHMKILDRKLGRASLPGGASGGGTPNVAPKIVAPIKEAPLPADAMDGIKQDLHFAVASAVRNVLDQHPGGVVLLNVPDHNKPAGFFNGDGAGFLHQSVKEQRDLNGKLAEDVCALRDQIQQLEQTLSRTSMEAGSRPDSSGEGEGNGRSLENIETKGFLPLHALTPSKKSIR